MRLLLDTHAIAWWLFNDSRLSSSIRALIADPQNDVFASAISAFEMATKFHNGKWNDIGPLVMAFEQAMAAERFVVLDVSARHAVQAGLLDGNHKDPFNRMIAAQCTIEGLLLISADSAFKAFGVEPLW